jgi:hypothetical protein
LTIGDGCVYVWIVKTEECSRLINQNPNSIDQQAIVSIAINPNNRLQVFFYTSTKYFKIFIFNLCVGEQNCLC